ncbi:MAG: hypothetical protein K2M73_04090 [Lachnospiraceae bacterium]|nr:hypothetical protein [Lachnospiraceae bacterium]MDE6698152.1 hypothetical protein [Lachnospiraceae bacterium]
MKAQNILYGDRDDLKELRMLLENQSNIANNLTVMNMEKQKLEKEALAEEKLMQDNIEFTVKKRREQIVSNFDNEISKSQDKLKKVRNERGKEKDKKIKKRIQEETKDLVQENRNIKEEYRTYMKQKGLSRWWDNKLIMSLFFPRTPTEMLILMAFLIAAVIGVPVMLCTLMGNTFWLIKTLVVLIYMALFVVIFAFVYRFARDDYKADFLEVRSKQAIIMKNNSRIAKIKRDIRHDKNEEGYELNKYDKEIKEIEDIIEDIVNRKNEALSEFEKSTRVDIQEEIYKRDIVSIEDKKNKTAELAVKIKDYEEQQKEVALNVSTNYTAYMGEENLSLDRIEKLIMIMDDGKAETIGDAINVLKTM